MDVPDRILQPLRRRFVRELLEEGQVVVDGARDDVEIEPLRRARLLEHEQRQALRRPVGQPFLDRRPLPFDLEIFCALLVEEELVVEALRRLAAEDAADLAGSSTEAIRSLPDIS